MEDLITFIVKQLVDHPDQVRVVPTHKDLENPAFEIHVDDKDRGKVIGREGQTIKAIRGLLSAVVPEGIVSVTIADATK